MIFIKLFNLIQNYFQGFHPIPTKLGIQDYLEKDKQERQAKSCSHPTIEVASLVKSSMLMNWKTEIEAERIGYTVPSGYTV